MEYGGVRLTAQALLERYSAEAPQYVLHARRLKSFIDARDEAASNEARFINHAVAGTSANVRFTECGFVRAKRRIRQGEELLAKYGVVMGRRVNDEVRTKAPRALSCAIAVPVGVESARSAI